jgi:hypothetical protein
LGALVRRTRLAPAGTASGSRFSPCSVTESVTSSSLHSRVAVAGHGRLERGVRGHVEGVVLLPDLWSTVPLPFTVFSVPVKPPPGGFCDWGASSGGRSERKDDQLEGQEHGRRSGPRLELSLGQLQRREPESLIEVDGVGLWCRNWF